MMAANELSFAGLILNIDTVKADTWEVTQLSFIWRFC